MRINTLCLNPTKTEYMIIDHPRRGKSRELLPQVLINREKGKQIDKTKYLGVIVDDTLGREEQYESVKKKVAGGFAAMKKLKGILPQSMIFQVYKALVESHLRWLNLDFSRKSFNFTGLKTWKSIPTHIRESCTLTLLKNGLKSHFLSWGKICFRTNSWKNSTGFYMYY